MEAMAKEIPVISTRITGIPELIEHEVDGLLAVPGVQALDKVRVRKSGLSHLVDIQVRVDGDLTVRDRRVFLKTLEGLRRAFVASAGQVAHGAAQVLDGLSGSATDAGMVGAIIGEFNREIRLEWVQPPRVPPLPVVEIVPANWYNPLMIYSRFFVPGILVMLVTGGSIFLTTMNIVREKEIGTMDGATARPVEPT